MSVGERLARDHRHDGDRRQRDEDVAAPARERAGELAAAAEPAERRLARRGDLQRRAGDEQDHGEVEQRGQRAVAVGAEDAREDDGEDDLRRGSPPSWRRRGRSPCRSRDRSGGPPAARGRRRRADVRPARVPASSSRRMTLAERACSTLRAHAGLASISGCRGHGRSRCCLPRPRRRARATSSTPTRSRDQSRHRPRRRRPRRRPAAAQPAQATPAPAAAAPAASNAPAQAAQLPRTGWDAGVPGVLGLVLMSAGVALRARVRRSP